MAAPVPVDAQGYPVDVGWIADLCDADEFAKCRWTDPLPVRAGITFTTTEEAL